MLWARFIREVDPVRPMRAGLKWIRWVHRKAGEAAKVLKRKPEVKQI